MLSKPQAARFGIDGAAFDVDSTERAIGALHWARLCALDATFAAPPNNAAKHRLAANGARADPCGQMFDVAIVGGGLSVLLAPLLAMDGRSVCVVERTRAASVHREWNASQAELNVLVAQGLLSAEELADCVMARYRHGRCAWHGHAPTTVKGVLDCAVDASKLLALARTRAEARGVQFFDGAQLTGLHPGDDAVALEMRVDGKPLPLRCRTMIDARGVQSPYARPDLLCPTVGGVLTDLEEGDDLDQWRADVGDILASTAGLEDGRQYLWEAFPGRPGELTVYLFAYVPAEAASALSLRALYARFWHTLAQFKRGRPRLLRPTYGYIPGWSRRTTGSVSPHRRILLVGDAATRHSPLTFCGFGAMLRSLGPTRRAVAHVLHGRSTKPPLAVDDTGLHAETGLLAWMMAHPPTHDAQALNDLLAAAFATLASLGNPTYAALLQDRLPAREMVRFLWQTSRRHPAVWRQVRAQVGPLHALRWFGKLGARAYVGSGRDAGSDPSGV